jgi:hypothetical protein
MSLKRASTSHLTTNDYNNNNKRWCFSAQVLHHHHHQKPDLFLLFAPPPLYGGGGTTLLVMHVAVKVLPIPTSNKTFFCHTKTHHAQFSALLPFIYIDECQPRPNNQQQQSNPTKPSSL